MEAIPFFERMFLTFIAYSFLGWAGEVIYCFALDRRFTNRGFLHGPLCPVYGFGGLLVAYPLASLAGNPVALFFAAALATSVLEYLTGWALETLFSTKWWDYSRYRLQIHGRVWIVNSALFGLAAVGATYFVQPAVASALDRSPSFARHFAAASLGALFLGDLAFTLRAMVGFRLRLAALESFVESLRENLAAREWFNERDLSGSLARIRERARIERTALNERVASRLETLLRRSRSMRRLIRAFPTMRSRRHAPQLELFQHLYRRLSREDKRSKK